MHNLCIGRKRSVEICCEGIADDVNLQLTRIVSIDFCVSLCDTVCVIGVLVFARKDCSIT